MTGPSVWQTCLKTVMQQTFHQAYWQSFTLVKADNEALREAAFRLRYQVYCTDSRFASASRQGHDGPALLESDAFDARATQFLLIHNKSGDTAGTVRILTPLESSGGLELQEICHHPLLKDAERIPHLCEISRLCMAPQFRRRPGDGRILPAYTEQQMESDLAPVGRALIRRSITYAPLGLLMAAFETVMDSGHADAVMMVDPSDLRSLKRLGIFYKTLGAKIQAYGPHQPVIFNVRAALDNMEAVNPECWEVMSDKGRLNHRSHGRLESHPQPSIFDETAKTGFLGRFF